jgi:nucleoside-diphosphate-sugar epimerase
MPRILAVARGGVFPLPGAGRSLADLTYVDNAVDAVEQALAAPAALEGRAYNITNGEPLPVAAMLRQLFTALDLRVRFVPVPRRVAQWGAALSERLASLRPGQPEPRITRYGIGLLSYTQTLSIAAARRELGYAPRISIAAGLERFAASVSR